MSTADKLTAIEQLWDDLSSHPANVPSPAWHGEVLESRAASGEFADLNEVKERLRNKSR
ncbi:addiction module antitoxin RelB [Mariprofundus ferrooxydans]|nr:addiction module antitoxin RelB [Mariprofundus ferrooxydans]